MSINQNAPVITRRDIVIDAPIQQIWDVHVDVDRWPEWQPDVVRAEAEEPLGPGSVFRWTTSGLDITSTVVAVDAPHRVEWGGPANGIVGMHVWQLSESPDGVHVHTEESWEGEPIEAAVEAMQQALDASLDEWLRRLKARAEQHSEG